MCIVRLMSDRAHMKDDGTLTAGLGLGALLALLVALLWFALSYSLVFRLVEAEDNPDASAPVPLLLKAACAVAFFPMKYLHNWEGGRTTSLTRDLLLNTIWWGIFIGGSCSLAARLILRRIQSKARFSEPSAAPNGGPPRSLAIPAPRGGRHR
jgi:hypothetical protein